MELSVPIGVGSGLMIPATIVAFHNSVQRNEIGVASALAAFTLNLGGAIGVASLGAIQANRLSAQLSILLVGIPPNGRVVLSDPNLVGQILASPAALARLLAANPSLAAFIPPLREAFSQSILILFLVLLGASVPVFVAGLLVKGEEKKQPPPPPTQTSPPNGPLSRGGLGRGAA